MSERFHFRHRRHILVKARINCAVKLTYSSPLDNFPTPVSQALSTTTVAYRYPAEAETA